MALKELPGAISYSYSYLLSLISYLVSPAGPVRGAAHICWHRLYTHLGPARLVFRRNGIPWCATPRPAVAVESTLGSVKSRFGARRAPPGEWRDEPTLAPAARHEAPDAFQGLLDLGQGRGVAGAHKPAA